MKNNGLFKMVMLSMLSIFALQTSTSAQKLKVEGNVSDSKTGEGMPLVNVGLMRPADTVFVRGDATDFEGNFSIKDVSPGTYLLQVTFVGYHTHYQLIDVKDNVNDVKVALKAGTTLQEVQITAERPLYAMEGEKNMYNTKEDPSIQTGTASDALQNAPGVEVDAEGNITLRGVSSVEIWINDRPSHMNEEALKQYIKQLPANAIERIEVITNPSARYSTNGGVINIVTNQKITRNELLCLGVRARTTPSVSPWISYVWANEKVDFNFYLNGDYSRHEWANDGTATLFDDNGDTSRYQEYTGGGNSNSKGGYVGFNVNWQIDSMTNLAAWMGAYPYWSNSTSISNYQYFEYQPTLMSLGYNDTSINDGFGGGGYAGAWLEHRFDNEGHKLSFSFNGNLWTNQGTDDQIRDFTSALLTDLHRREESYSMSPSASLSVDYSLPLKNKFELETGAELGYSHTPNRDKLDSMNTAGTWDNIALRSFNGTGTAWQPEAYVTLQKSWGNFTAKAGLRAEMINMNGSVAHEGETPIELDTTLYYLVPSIHLSYRTKTFANYSLSYTRRTTAQSNLLDFSTFCIYDDYSYRTGNPALRMSYTHNVEAAWSQYLMGFGMLGLNAYFRANTDEQGTMTAAGYAPDYFPSNQLVNYTYPDNIGYSHTEGLEANITYRPTAFLNVRLNGSVFNYGYTYNGDTDSRVSWSARLNVWTKLWNRLEVFANARYSSPRLSLYSLSNANKGIDLGVSSDFFDRKLSVYFNVNDIFGWSEWGSNTTAPQYQTTGSQRYNSRFVSLGLTWRMGKMELESKARQGATDSQMPQM